MKKKVIALFGPTAVGKTQTAFALQDTFGCPVISVDSAMVYRGMDIGTSKPDRATLERYPHDLVDIREITDFYSVQEFIVEATAKIESYHAQGKTPVLVGGTMLYFAALQKGLSALPASSVATRALVQQRLETEGLAALYAELRRYDPQRATMLHAHDTQRILRAIEILTQTGQPMSAFLQTAPQATAWDWISIALVPFDRAVLHHTIAQRWHEMIAQGLVAEVEALMRTPGFCVDLPAMRAVGYRQILDYLSGGCTVAERDAAACAATRQLAKRQLTWIKSWESCYSVTVELTASAIKYVKSLLQSQIA